MTLTDLDDPGAVLRAVEEFDRRGRAEFLSHYGFRGARGYFLMLDGRRYDSKAIVGVAHLYQHGVLLQHDSFSGGERTVVARLEALGFEVEMPITPPRWTTDELMLTLDFYLRTRGKISYRATAPAIVDLSKELRSLRIFSTETRSNPAFRNPAGVALKLHNFAALDPSNAGQGMPHVSKGDREVWRLWADRQGELASAAILIRAEGRVESPPDTRELEEYEAPEGRVLFRIHRRRERDPRLVKEKRDEALRRTGRLACEVCDFDSREEYGIEGVIDVHHILPLHVAGPSVTKIGDLALVCPTCHRLLHKHRPIVTPAELRERRRARSSTRRGR